MRKSTFILVLFYFIFGIVFQVVAQKNAIGDEVLIEIGGKQGKIPPKSQVKSGKSVSEMSVEELKVMAESGDREAQYQFGRICLSGGELEKNESEGAKWLLASARQSLLPAQTAVGRLYRDGIGVDKDYFQAVKWFRSAVEAGDMQAKIELGMMYYDGKGVHCDFIEAYSLLNLASGVIEIAPQGSYASAGKALEELSKTLSPEQKELALNQMDSSRDQYIRRLMEKKK